MRGSLSLMALLLSAAGFLRRKIWSIFRLTGLQLRVPLFLFVVGVIQAGFLGNNAARSRPATLSGGQPGNAMCLEIPGGCIGYEKIALMRLPVCFAGFGGFLRFSGRRGRAWSWRRQVPVAATPFSLAASFPAFSVRRWSGAFPHRRYQKQLPTAPGK